MRLNRFALPIGFLLLAAVTPITAVAQAADRQIALAVLPLPEAERVSATVLGYEDGTVVPLRRGTGDFICLADRPGDDRFQAACYHKSLAPYMARGRELHAQGITGQPSIERRWEEIEAGRLEMPRHPAALHQLFGSDPSTVSPENMEGLNHLTVIYMAYATAEQTGLPSRPGDGVPWLMFPGKPTAHVMISR